MPRNYWSGGFRQSVSAGTVIELLRLCPSRILSRIKITERIESYPVHILIHGIHVILQERFDKVIIIPAPGKPVLDHDLNGFTEKEVFAALEEYGLSDQKQKVKDWYDGFTFGEKSDIYNPWSIINYLDEGKVGAYWANTSSNRLSLLSNYSNRKK